MKNSLSFNVTIEFEDRISDDKGIVEVAENIARAIKRETNAGGIAPSLSDTYSLHVHVKPQFLTEIVTLNMLD